MKHEKYITLDKFSASDLNGKPVRVQLGSIANAWGQPGTKGFFKVEQHEEGSVVSILESLDGAESFVREHLLQSQYAAIRLADDGIFELPFSY